MSIDLRHDARYSEDYGFEITEWDDLLLLHQAKQACTIVNDENFRGIDSMVYPFLNSLIDELVTRKVLSSRVVGYTIEESWDTIIKLIENSIKREEFIQAVRAMPANDLPDPSILSKVEVTDGNN